MLPGGRFEWEQLRAGPKLLFSTRAEAARLLAGWSRFMINLLSQGHPSFKTVSMFKGPHRAGPQSWAPGRILILLAPWWYSDLGNSANTCTPAHC